MSIKTPADMLDEVLNIISLELGKIKVKAESEDTLALTDSKSLNDYARTLASTNREKRESAKGSKVESLKDEELMELAAEALRTLKDGE